MAATLLVASTGRTALAGTNQWTTHGPFVPLAIEEQVAIDPGNPNLVYTNAARSTDGGLTWQAYNLSSVNYGLASVGVGPPGTVYVGTGIDSSGILFKSVDAGVTWSPIQFGGACTAETSISVDPIVPTTVYVSTISCPNSVPGVAHGGLSKSIDGGRTWRDISDELPLTGATVKAPAVDPLNRNTLYTSRFKSTDGGSTWIQLSLPPGAGGTRGGWAIDPVTSATVYLASYGGVFKSTDGGNSFMFLNTGLQNQELGDIVIDRNRPDHLYVASEFGGGGVFASPDGGLAWQSIGNGLTDPVTSLAIDSNGTSLHAATASGVFDYHVVSDPGILTIAAAQDSLAVFSITLTATHEPTGRTGPGLATKMNNIAGYFSIPSITGNPNNPEVFVKVIDGTRLNGRYWFFYGGLTDLEYTLTVTQDETGNTRTYTKPQDSACGGFDTEAFSP